MKKDPTQEAASDEAQDVTKSLDTCKQSGYLFESNSPLMFLLKNCQKNSRTGQKNHNQTFVTLHCECKKRREKLADEISVMMALVLYTEKMH